MLYIITFLKKGEFVPDQVVVGSNQCLFNLLSILNSSDKVLKFKVSSDMILTNAHFGWGEFEKWLDKIFEEK